MSRIVLKLGGRVASDAAAQALALAAPKVTTSSSSTAPARRSPRRWHGAGSRPPSSDGRRVTTAEVLDVVRDSLVEVNAEVCAAIGPQAIPLFGDEIGLSASQVEALGLVGDPMPSAPAPIEEALAAGRIPVVAPLAARAGDGASLNVNADEAAAALAVGLGAERILFVSDVPGVLLGEHVVDRIAADDADRMLGDGTFEGGIVPEARGRRRSRARGGVRAADRRDGGGGVTAASDGRSHKRRRCCATPCSRPMPGRTSRSCAATAAASGTTRAASTSTSSPESRSSASATARLRRSSPRGSSSTGSGTRRTSTGRSRCCGSPALLAERFEGGRAFFCNSGAEANEAALKIARKATGRTRIVALEGGFHGRTLGALSATGQPAKWEGFGPLLPGVSFAQPNDIESLEAALAPAGDTALVLLEPVLGEGGVIPLEPAFAQAASELAREIGALLCVDEVQAGMGRTGTFFAYEQLGIEPDLVTLAKGLANGLPMGALLAGERAAPGFVPGDHGSTFGGNPVAAAAAAVAIVEAIDDELLAHVR